MPDDQTTPPEEAEVIVTERGDRIWTIGLNRPTKHNALKVSMLAAIVSTLEDVADRGARAVVLHGHGRSFSAGGDVRALQAMESDEEVAQYLGSYAEVGRAISAAPFPVIAALHGIVYGGGLELACMCDFRVVDPDTQLCAADITIGLVPTGGLTWRLPRLLGPGLSAWYLLTNAVFDGERALSAGMCEVLSERDGSLAAALQTAGVIAQFPGAAVAASKEALRRAESGQLNEAAAFEVRTNVQRMHDHDVVRLLNQAFPRSSNALRGRASGPPS